MHSDSGKQAGDFEIPRYTIFLGLKGLLLIWFVVLAVQGLATQAVSVLLALGGAMLFSASCVAVGQLVVPNTQILALRFTAGLVVLYLLAFVLGLLHLYSSLLLTILAFAPAVLLLRRSVVGNARLYFSQPARFGRQELVLCVLAIAAGAYCFLLWQTPVTHYDALTNHLAIPAEYLARGGIETIPYNLHANLPPASHMVYLFLIAAAGPQSVQAFQFLLLLMLASSFRAITGKDSIAWLYAWILFAVIPQVTLLLSLTSIDFLTTLFCVMAFYLFLRALEGESVVLPLTLLLAFLCALKYQSVLFVGLLLLLFVRRAPRQAFLVGGCIVLLSIPYLWRNYRATGDPVFPFGASQFQMSEEDSREAAGFVSANSHMPEHPKASDFARTFFRSYTRLPETGVVSLLLLLCLFYLRQLQFRFKYMLLFFAVVPVAAHSFLSLNVVNVLRWVQYSFAFLCILVGICMAEQQRKSLHAVFATCVAASFLLSFSLSSRLTQAIQVGTGRLSAVDYRMRFIPSFELRKQVKALEGKVLFLGEPRAFYNVENSVIPSDYDFLYLRKYFAEAGNAEQLRDAFRSDGIRYLFLNTAGITAQIRTPRYEWLRGEKIRRLQQLTAGSRIVAQDSASLIFDLDAAQQPPNR